MTKFTADTLLDGIRTATAAWNAPQSTAYYAERYGVSYNTMYRWLRKLEAAGLVVCHRRPRSGLSANTWDVLP